MRVVRGRHRLRFEHESHELHECFFLYGLHELRGCFSFSTV